MKKISILVSFFLLVASIKAQQVENIIIITTDGFRWQEVFKGMDSAIANNSKFNQGDSSYIFEKYWSYNENERRKKLMPFFWNTIVNHGQIYGNRTVGNKVNNANPHWFSYPGYSEIMTGFADSTIDSNEFPPNPHVTVLEFLNQQPKFKNKVAAFGAWGAFDRILNQQRSGLPVFSAFDTIGGKNPNANEKLINSMMQDSYRPFGNEECLDVFTHYAAMEYLKNKKPKVLYISYGETDEWAHHGYYGSYLDAAHLVDKWIKEMWTFLQSDPQYKNKTAIFFTTDHGRGDLNKEEWTSHGSSIADAYQIWFAAMGPNIASTGEQKNNIQLFQDQFAQTIAKLLGYIYKATHPISPEIKSVLSK
ncbi:MAG TPA: alkaline phosphatase family protein [Chitinophagaceae bacterium]|nr:alkaline phosphatase family protein [Chitinophagaceae bacterium]